MNKTDFTEKSKKHFDAIAAVYPNSWDGRFCEPGYLPLVNELKNYASGKWLDVSCGTGTLLEMLSDSKLEKYGADFSEKMIAEARCRLGDNAQLFVAPAEQMPFEADTFDVITCSFAFHHYVHPDAVLQELHRILKPNAKLIIVDSFIPQPIRFFMNPLLRFANNGDYHMYGRNEIKKLLCQHSFQMQEYTRIDKHIFSYKSIAI
jgi:ubiquinone/menaquinone biosynthesis C-methylase UbiE